VHRFPRTLQQPKLKLKLAKEHHIMEVTMKKYQKSSDADKLKLCSPHWLHLKEAVNDVRGNV
jgi:hypothetical protein